MERAFLEEWNLEFGVKPPEWVFHFASKHQQHMLEDIDREIGKREANIDELELELKQERFLLGWLCETKTKLQSKDTEPAPSLFQENSQESYVNGVCSSPDVSHEENLSEESNNLPEVQINDPLDKPEDTDQIQKPPSGQEHSEQDTPLTRQDSPPQLESNSTESLKSTTDSSEYHTAAGVSSCDTLDTNLADDSPLDTSSSSTSPVISRQRIAHKVHDSDAQVARAVSRRLIEQGRHWSCQFIDLEGKNETPLLPEESSTLIRRSLSDPVRRVSEDLSSLLPTESTRRRIASSVLTNPSAQFTTDQHIELSNTLKPIDSVHLKSTEQKDNNADTTEQVMQTDSDVKSPVRNEGGSAPIVGKRSSNGILLDSLETKKIYAMEDDDQVEQSFLSSMGSRAQRTRTPRSSVDQSRIRVVRLSNGDLDGSPKHHYSVEDDKENSMSGDSDPNYQKHRNSTDLSPLAPVPKYERRSVNFEDDECMTPRGDLSMSLTPDALDTMNNTSESSEPVSDDLMSSLEDPTMAITKERASLVQQRLDLGRKETLTLESVARMGSILDNLESLEEEKDNNSFSTLTLTRDRAQVQEEMETGGSTIPLSRLDSLSEELQKALSQISSTPDMSMATLLDMEENAEMNDQLHQSESEPSLDDLELFESGDVDEATISAYTLRSDLFGSSTSIPSLFTGGDSLSSTCSSPPDLPASPSHGLVNLRPSSGGRRKQRKRMGNADFDSITTAGSDDGSDTSPSHVLRSSMSPLADDNGDIFSPVGPGPYTNSSNETNTEFSEPHVEPPQSPLERSSRIFHGVQVRRSTVVVHGEQLVIRKLVVAGIVSAEKTYIDCLTAMREKLVQSITEGEEAESIIILPHTLIEGYYRKPLLARTTTTQPILTERDVNTIFYRVEDLCILHTALHEQLEPSLANWSIKSCVGEFFVHLCRNLKLYKDYVEMYKKSVGCLNKHKQENPTFKAFVEDVHATVSAHLKDIPRVNELLRRPVERLQSYSLVLNDLCQHTPEDHPDYRILRESLQVMTAFIASTHDPQSFKHLSGGFNRELVKDGLVVELSDGIRKIRRSFLFHDVLVCSKQKPSRGGVKFEAKWYLPLNEISFKPPEDSADAHRPVPVTSDVELSVMKNKIAEYKAQLNKESGQRERSASVSSEKDDKSSFKRNLKAQIHLIKGKNADKYKKKLEEQQVSFWVASPSLPLRVYGRAGKQYMFLLHNEEEREAWVSAIKKLQPKAVTGVYLSSYELQDLLNRQTVKDLRKVEDMIIPTIDDEYLNGILRVRVTAAADLKAKTAGVYCCLELDEYGKFDRKARTMPASSDNATLITTWDQDFEIELAGAHILKIQICSKSLLKEETHATGKVRLPIKELKHSKRQKMEIKLVPQGSIDLILEYYSNMAAMSRKPSLLSSGVFGVPIDVVSKRERHDIPLIVQTCIDEIDRRGVSEVGIYRVAGVLRDVQELRQAFDTDYLKAQVIAFDADIHAVAGLLKRYFRELPDPLFTNELYTSFVQGLGLSDPEARAQCLLTLLHSLPPINFKTAVFLFRHLRRVADNSVENKMSLNNLSTVFGPNLLSPGGDEIRMDVVTPVSVVLFFLNCPEEFFDESLFANSPQSTSTSSSNKSRNTGGRGSFASGESEKKHDSGAVSAANRPSLDEQDFHLGSSPNRILSRKSRRGSNRLLTAIRGESSPKINIPSGKESVI